MITFLLLTEQVDEEECSRRRHECLDDMVELERQFSDIREQYVHVIKNLQQHYLE